MSTCLNIQYFQVYVIDIEKLTYNVESFLQFHKLHSLFIDVAILLKYQQIYFILVMMILNIYYF